MTQVSLDKLGKVMPISEVFKPLLKGKMINRNVDHKIWHAIEDNLDDYTNLFGALGYKLQVSEKGFAWFKAEQGSSVQNKRSRQLALLYCTIFEEQADANQPLSRFGSWQLDSKFIAELYEKYAAHFEAEEIDLDALVSLFKQACRFGYMQETTGVFQLLPATWRYLEYFEQLAQTHEAASKELAEVIDASADDFVEDDMDD